MGIMDMFKRDKPKGYVDADGKPVAPGHVSEITRESKAAARREVNGKLGKGGGKSLMGGMFDTAGIAGQGFFAVMLAMLAAKLLQGSKKFTGPLFSVFKGEAIEAGNAVADFVPGAHTAVAATKAAGRGIGAVMHSDPVQTGVKAVGGVADKVGDVVHGGVTAARDFDTRAAHTLDGTVRGGKPAALSTLRQQSGPPATVPPATVVIPPAASGAKTTVPHHATGAAGILDGGP